MNYDIDKCHYRQIPKENREMSIVIIMGLH